MRATFPRMREAWRNDVERRLTRLRADFAILWRLFPQTPEWPGIPLAGPLNPQQFVFIPQNSASNTTNIPSGSAEPIFTGVTPITGTSPLACCLECPSAAPVMRLTIADNFNGNSNTDCLVYNGTYDIGCGTVNGASRGSCQWYKDTGVTHEPTAGDLLRTKLILSVVYAQQSGSIVYDSGVNAGFTVLFIRLTLNGLGDGGSPADVIWRYKAAGCPPTIGGTKELRYDGVFVQFNGNTDPGSFECVFLPPETLTIEGRDQ